MSATISVKFTETDAEDGKVKIEVFVERFSPTQSELHIAKAFHASVVDCIDDVVKRTTQETEVKKDEQSIIITPDSN
jgi:hypothetical protein